MIIRKDALFYFHKFLMSIVTNFGEDWCVCSRAIWVMVGSLQALYEIRSSTGKAETDGLSDSTISEFLQIDPSLSRAIEEASVNFQSLINEMGDNLLSMNEGELSSFLQSDYVNFYSALFWPTR